MEELLPMHSDTSADEVCCGPPPAPPASGDERPGYVLQPFVKRFINTAAGPVPIVKTQWERKDWLDTAKVRAGIGRDDAKIAPGLYGVGNPDAEAPVLVSANYKLSFDTLRKNVAGLDAWILVLDTRGINVWCAAGKQLFGTDELIRLVKNTRLDQVVSHRRLILPQLGATGVAGRKVKKQTGFDVIWGPVRASDIRLFIQNKYHADDAMRRVTFSTPERVVLIPVELSFLPKPTLWFFGVAFLLSGISSEIFSFGVAWTRSLMMLCTYFAGVLAGAALTPAFLPLLPGRAFSIKGVFSGLFAAAGVLYLLKTPTLFLEKIALAVVAISISSYLAMNFTGSTPYTSPSGVEKEMRHAMPFQAGALLAGAVLWIWAGIVG